jgi:hypothetical protein
MSWPAMADDELLAGFSAESLERMAAYSANRARSKLLLYSDRREIALGAMIDYLLDWTIADPPPAAGLFKAADDAITYATSDYRRDHGYISSGPSDHSMLAPRGFATFWITPPAPADALGEAVTERIAVWQVLRALPYRQAKAIFALADAIRDDGDYHLAASRLGYADASMRTILKFARREIRQLWLADDETPRGQWGRDRGHNNTARGRSRAVRALRSRRGAARD